MDSRGSLAFSHSLAGELRLDCGYKRSLGNHRGGISCSGDWEAGRSGNSPSDPLCRGLELASCRRERSAASCSVACDQACGRPPAVERPAERRDWLPCVSGRGCARPRSPPLCAPSTKTTGCDRAATRDLCSTGRRTYSLIEAARMARAGAFRKTRLGPLFSSARLSASASTSHQRRIAISLLWWPVSNKR